MRRALQAVSWGTQLVPYAQALCLQEALAEQRHTGQLAVDTLILLQHAPVYTIGKRGTEADFKVPLKARLIWVAMTRGAHGTLTQVLHYMFHD